MSCRNLFFLDPGGGRWPFFYVLINKNACSAFKRVFRRLSPALGALADSAAPMKGVGDAMRRFHAAEPHDPLRDVHPTLCVVRDPWTRLVSAFTDKLVRLGGQGGGETFARAIRAATGLDPMGLSIRALVETYVRPGLETLDPHLALQATLVPPGPVVLIPLEDLHERLAASPGYGYLANFFTVRHNATRTEHLHRDADLDQTADTLHRRWCAEQALPAPECFAEAAFTSVVRTLYAADVELCRRAATALPP